MTVSCVLSYVWYLDFCVVWCLEMCQPKDEEKNDFACDASVLKTIIDACETPK